MPPPGVEQQFQRLAIRRAKPDFVVLRAFGVMNPVVLKTAQKVGYPTDHWSVISDWIASDWSLLRPIIENRLTTMPKLTTLPHASVRMTFKARTTPSCESVVFAIDIGASMRWPNRSSVH
ncbi:TPA: hypothetical protein R1R14_004214 [Enterobacter hormaechei]|nr:hypothetical protein [Enterobacter hormaechei]HBM7677510.1 hypothetical protein [Enterobacter asburiae]HBR1984257.1 hypothetical protein [Klebsiella quasipneumoniae subsp. quasipneumoniae]HCI6708496.1 hypothetical protein [Klebsiella quasipneumoniae subsp. similipneumoniae]HEC0360409.1 hypothetical protein [Enterobacter hormaechei]